MTLILFFNRRRRIIRRYLAVKKENRFLKGELNRLEQRIALFKLQEMARKKNPSQ